VAGYARTCFAGAQCPLTVAFTVLYKCTLLTYLRNEALRTQSNIATDLPRISAMNVQKPLD